MHPYQGKSAVISTKHGKGALVAPVFEKILEVSVTEIAVDTDLLGTRNIAHVAQLLAERISATCPICTSRYWQTSARNGRSRRVSMVQSVTITRLVTRSYYLDLARSAPHLLASIQ